MLISLQRASRLFFAPKNKVVFFVRNRKNAVPPKTSEKPIPPESNEDSTRIELSHLVLSKDLGLKLKKPSKFNQKKKNLESQLEEINVNHILKNFRESEAKKSLSSHTTSKAAHKIKSFDPKDPNIERKKKSLESQLEKMDYEINSVEDVKDSPNEILLQNYQEEQKKKINNNKLQMKKYIQGEQGIDLLETPPEIAESLNKELSYLTDEFNSIYQGFIGKDNSKHNLSKLEWIDEKNTVQKLNQLHNWEVKEYPGSSKGARPQDDPQHYYEWYQRNAPPVLLEASEEIAEMQNKEEIENSENQISLDMETMLANEVPLRHLAAVDPLEEMENSPAHLEMKTLTPTEEIGPYPEMEMMEWNTNVEHVERWLIFRMFPAIHKFKNIIREIHSKTEGKESQNEVILPTLYRYYNTLPKFARDSVIVKNLVKAFEFTKPTMSIREKELSLNYICQFTLPMDKLTEEVAKVAIIDGKHFITEEEEDHIMNEADPDIEHLIQEQIDEEEGLFENKKKEEEDPDEKKDIAKLLEEEEKIKKRQQRKELKLQIAQDMKDPYCNLTWKYNMWQRPMKIDPFIPMQDPGPNLPLEYYDNDDGFWNDFIKEKESKYDLYPMIYNRPYFKH